jgi:hypothetical protein
VMRECFHLQQEIWNLFQNQHEISYTGWRKSRSHESVKFSNFFFYHLQSRTRIREIRTKQVFSHDHDGDTSQWARFSVIFLLTPG